MKKSINSILIITLSSLLCACNNGGNTPSPSNNKDDAPYTKVTLTEEGARRINAASERQNRVRNELRKYSNWLMPKYLSLESKAAVNPGDEVDEDMNFEIYPSDFDNLNKMFLIGRTKPSSSETKGSTNLIDITTNIPKEEISDYSLNGQISYLDGAGDINHDRIEYDSIPYQKETELTMTYTYIKKGTAADTSPYSCQPSFHITKVDNEAPLLIEDSNLNLIASYKQTAAELKAKLANDIAANFIVNDGNLTINVDINLTDAELGTLMETAITNAKAASDHHFEAFNIPFTVYTANASTDVLKATVLLEDDIGPVVYKNNNPVQEITLNGGVITLPHKDVLDAGIGSLLENNGYSIVDEIEGNSSIVDYESMIHNDEDELIVSENILLGNRNEFAQLTVDFNFNDESHLMKIDYARSVSQIEGTEVATIISDLYINKGNTLFEEELKVSEVNFSGLGASGILIIASTNILTLNGLIGFIPTYLFLDYDSIKDEDKSKCFVFDPESTSGMEPDHIYLDVSTYNSDWYYAENYKSNTYNLFAVSNFYEGTTPRQINYNYTLEQFKTKFNIVY